MVLVFSQAPVERAVVAQEVGRQVVEEAVEGAEGVVAAKL